MPADDLSSLYQLLVESQRALAGDAAASKRAAEWLGWLERHAATASTPAARTVFDSHRLAAAIAAGDPERAVPALLQSELELPRDYNAPARLALAYKQAGRLDQALAAAYRALRLVYGPRKLRIFSTKADILEAKGDRAALARLLKQASRYARSLPEAQRPARLVESLEQRRRALDTPPSKATG